MTRPKFTRVIMFRRRRRNAKPYTLHAVDDISRVGSTRSAFYPFSAVVRTGSSIFDLGRVTPTAETQNIMISSGSRHRTRVRLGSFVPRVRPYIQYARYTIYDIRIVHSHVHGFTFVYEQVIVLHCTTICV